MKAFSRVKPLIGEEGYKKLASSKIIIFGIGGVGGYVAEALVRSGVENLTLVDCDVVEESNINRQISATVDTVGKMKTEVLKQRFLSINSNAKIETLNFFYDITTADEINLSDYDYVVDAIDSVESKIELIVRAKKEKVNIISSMGTGGKINPLDLRVADIYKTTECPLAKVIRKRLRVKGITGLKTVYSVEKKEVNDLVGKEKKADGKTAMPSMIFVPATAGLVIASEVVKDLIRS